jgi:hypothetical protein
MGMRNDIPAVRIWPMSDQLEGFVGRSIEDVQAGCFLRDLPACKGCYRYPKAGLNAPPGTVVLFQYRARIIASAVFLRDEKYDQPVDGCGGAIYLDVASIRTFDPLDVEAMRKAWPSSTRFGHVKQYLNPARYPMFERRLKNVASVKMRTQRRREAEVGGGRAKAQGRNRVSS